MASQAGHLELCPLCSMVEQGRRLHPSSSLGMGEWRVTWPLLRGLVTHLGLPFPRGTRDAKVQFEDPKTAYLPMVVTSSSIKPPLRDSSSQTLKQPHTVHCPHRPAETPTRLFIHEYLYQLQLMESTWVAGATGTDVLFIDPTLAQEPWCPCLEFSQLLNSVQ